MAHRATRDIVWVRFLSSTRSEGLYLTWRYDRGVNAFLRVQLSLDVTGDYTGCHLLALNY
jgi:hypothetical protein